MKNLKERLQKELELSRSDGAYASGEKRAWHQGYEGGILYAIKEIDNSSLLEVTEDLLEMVKKNTGGVE